MPLIRDAKLSLHDFCVEMMMTPPEQLTVDALREHAMRLDLSDRLIAEHIRFREGHYARNLVCRTTRFDMLVLCWEPGQHSTIHDHAGSLNVTRVYDGRLTSRLFDAGERIAPDRVLVTQRAEEFLTPNTFACVDRDEVHQLANTSSGRLVTVHIYAKPLKDVNVFDPVSGVVERVPLRFTLEDDIGA